MTAVTVFGEWADEFDVRFEESLEWLDSWVSENCQSTQSLRDEINCRDTILAATFLNVAMTLGRAEVDVLRLGEGSSEGSALGAAQDGLRFLALAGPLFAVASRGFRLLRVATAPRQAASGALMTMDCAWVSAIQAIRQTGQKYFVRLKDLFRAAGFDRYEELAMTLHEGTDVAGWLRLIDALRDLRINIHTHSTFVTLGQIARYVAQRAERVFIVAFEYDSVTPNGGTATFGHVLRVVWNRGEVLFLDTTGAVYRGLSELRSVYTNAEFITDCPLIEIPNSLVMALEQAGMGAAVSPAAEAAAESTADVFLEVVPATRGVRGLHAPPPRTVSGRRGLHGNGVRADGTLVGRPRPRILVREPGLVEQLFLSWD